MLQLKATCVIHQNERAKYRLRSFHSSASSMCNGLTHPAVSPVFESMMAWDKHRDIVKIYLYCRLHCATSVAKWGMERSDDPPSLLPALKGHFSADCLNANTLNIVRL